MIDIASLSKEWLTEKQQKYKRDPSIIESMIHALYLLEQLKLTGLDFIFKGGTSLILIMEQPARFSVDIDIIVKPDLTRKELEKYLNKIADLAEIFSRVELDERRSYNSSIPKAHYKFIYKSVLVADNEEAVNSEREILLDVLFAENPYPVLVEKPIITEWIKFKDDPITVQMPCHNSIAGDKLTAFAPNTTGVPYYRESVNKEGTIYKNGMFKEIIKQLFDVGSLFDVMDDLEVFRKSYESSASGEMKYRAEKGIKSKDEILEDTIATAYIIARREKYLENSHKEHFANLSAGITQFGNFVYSGNFRIEQAQLAGAKAAYLAAIVLKEHKGPLAKFDEKISINNYQIKHTEYNYLNKQLRFVLKGEALFYWYQTIKLLYPENKEPIVIRTSTSFIERLGLSLKPDVPVQIFVNNGINYYETTFYLRYPPSAYGKQVTLSLMDANGQSITQQMQLTKGGNISYEFSTEQNIGPNFGFLQLNSATELTLEIWSEISNAKFL